MVRTNGCTWTFGVSCKVAGSEEIRMLLIFGVMNLKSAVEMRMKRSKRVR
jgi:hypothetical protein